jgi:hypothetical protein
MQIDNDQITRAEKSFADAACGDENAFFIKAYADIPVIGCHVGSGVHPPPDFNDIGFA